MPYKDVTTSCFQCRGIRNYLLSTCQPPKTEINTDSRYMECHAIGIMPDICKSPEHCITEYLLVGSALSLLINNKDLEERWQEVQIAVRQAHEEDERAAD